MTASEELTAMLQSVTREVLETMFFSDAEPVPCRHSGPWTSSQVSFHGAPAGFLTVMLSPELAQAVSAGFLAEDPENVTPAQRSQVSCELANILCGAILSRLHPDARVTLNAPQPVEPDFSPSVHQCFETPEGMLAVTVRMH